MYKKHRTIGIIEEGKIDFFKGKDRRCYYIYINTEEKAKVVVAARRTEFIQFLATRWLSCRAILKNRMKSTFSLNYPSAIPPILQNRPNTQQLARQGIEKILIYIYI